MSEEQFRGILDARGVLLPGNVEAPDRSTAYAVFAQRSDAMLDVAALKKHGARFFATKLGLTVDKHYGSNVPDADAARIVVATNDGAVSGTRLCFGRPAGAQDQAAAQRAERAQGTSGMSLLAQRCGTLWLVEKEGEGEADDDRPSLLIAAILASTLLGPILSPSGEEIFGVRTARMKLDR